LVKLYNRLRAPVNTVFGDFWGCPNAPDSGIKATMLATLLLVSDPVVVGFPLPEQLADSPQRRLAWYAV